MGGFLKELYKYRNVLPHKTNPYLESALDLIEELAKLKEPTGHVIGAFGSTVFEVSSLKVETIKNLRRRMRARYATHEVLNKKSVLEYEGLEPEEITFELQLNAELGVNVRDELSKLYAMLREGEANYLILGGHAYGQNEWVLTGLNVKTEYTDGLGVPIYVELEAELKECVRRGWT